MTANEWSRLSADCVGGSGVNMFEIKMDIHLRRRDTHRCIGWILDKPKDSQAHLPSRVNYLGGNLVQSC